MWQCSAHARSAHEARYPNHQAKTVSDSNKVNAHLLRPFGDLPVMAALDQLRLDNDVTLLAGDNGTGKSTFLELIAAAIGFADEGGELERSGELPAVPRGVLRDALVPGDLPQVLRGKNLFWINIKQFLQSSDSDLPAENYLMHWQAVYQCFLEEDAAALRGLSYVTTEDPFAKKQQH